MAAYTQEIFGPVAPVIPLRTDAEAIELANDTEYGLIKAVHPRSIPHALGVAGQL